MVAIFFSVLLELQGYEMFEKRQTLFVLKKSACHLKSMARQVTQM